MLPDILCPSYWSWGFQIFIESTEDCAVLGTVGDRVHPSTGIVECLGQQNQTEEEKLSFKIVTVSKRGDGQGGSSARPETWHWNGNGQSTYEASCAKSVTIQHFRDQATKSVVTAVGRW